MFEGMPIINVMTRSFSMWLLIAVSIAGLTFCIERFLYFRKQKEDLNEFESIIERKVKEGDMAGLRKECDKRDNIYGRALKEGLKHESVNEQEAKELISTAIGREKIGLENNLVIIGTISHIAPLLGLFGTVAGIIRAFRDVAITGSGGSSVVAMGVAIALVTTATGILIAVPAVIFYNYFVRRVAVISSECGTMRDKFIALLKIYRKK